ncbi:MAG: chromosomal replication initiator protein DnaA [Solirubrobacteraceae bacterium]
MELPAHPGANPAWREIRAELRQAVGQSTYEIWLGPLELKSLEGGTLLIAAPGDTQAWVAKRFGRIIEQSATLVLGFPIRVEFAGTARASAGHSLAAPRSDPVPSASLNPRYSFHQFIIGDGNRLAHAAALAVAELPGQAYNPLFLHAPPGLGKTHLLHAIGNYVLSSAGGATVRYTTVEEFTNHFITALGTRSIDRFKRAYRDSDVLLIDDVQFLASKAKTEEEFFHTFNALYETGRQLVLTCDRLPRQMSTIEQRLRERFECGLVADIQPPDFATRVAILRKRAALDRIALDDPSMLELIAERITDNIRSLEGALIRIVAHHSLTRRPLDAELANSVLDGICPRMPSGRPTVAVIQAAVASYYKISIGELISPLRANRVVWPRQVAIHLAREHTDSSLHTLGDAFGGRSHATVLHACKRVSDRRTTDSEIDLEITYLSQKLAGR